jgi:hypothetical protein
MLQQKARTILVWIAGDNNLTDYGMVDELQLERRYMLARRTDGRPVLWRQRRVRLAAPLTVRPQHDVLEQLCITRCSSRSRWARATCLRNARDSWCLVTVLA